MALAHFSCPGCNRKYKWMAQVAGKTLRCPCGSSVKCPADSEPDEYMPSADTLAFQAISDELDEDPVPSRSTSRTPLGVARRHKPDLSVDQADNSSRSKAARAAASKRNESSDMIDLDMDLDANPADDSDIDATVAIATSRSAAPAAPTRSARQAARTRPSVHGSATARRSMVTTSNEPDATIVMAAIPEPAIETPSPVRPRPASIATPPQSRPTAGASNKPHHSAVKVTPESWFNKLLRILRLRK